MNIITLGTQRSIVSDLAIRNAVKCYEAAKRAERKGFVGSPVQERGYNKYFPEGCSKKLNQAFIMRNNPIIIHNKKIVLSRDRQEERLALKQAKKECVNKGKMTTIFSNKL